MCNKINNILATLKVTSYNEYWYYGCIEGNILWEKVSRRHFAINLKLIMIS